MQIDNRLISAAKALTSERTDRRLEVDAAIYAWRHLIENFSCKLKEFKRIAIRACKADRSFEAMIYIAAVVIISR